MSKEARPLIMTRVFGTFPRERIDSTVQAFSEVATTHGPVLIISHDSYEHRQRLSSAVAANRASENDLQVVYSNSGNPKVGRVDHATMLNLGIATCAQRGMDYFASVSSDLAPHLPFVLQPMVNRLATNSHLTTVGVAIDRVHDQELLDRIEAEGMGVVNNGNFGKLLPSNTLAVHRLRPVVNGTSLDISERFFNQFGEADLGSFTHGDQRIPLWGHEGVELPLRLLSQNKPPNILLLAGDVSVARDNTTEVPSHAFKTVSRQPVAEAYQRFYNLSDAVLNNYLGNHFQVEFIRNGNGTG